MRAIRLIQKPQNGQIIFNVPDEMRDQTIIIDFQPVRENEMRKQTLAEAADQFYAKLTHVKIDFDMEDFNVYDQ